MMPPLAKGIVDADGEALIQQWINQMVDLTISYTLQGRTEHAANLLVDVYTSGGTTPIYQFTPTGSSTGEAMINGIAPGTYDIVVKTATHLQTMQTITITAGANALNVGELLAGDANDDNQITLLDFTILATSFNLNSGNAGYDDRADFNGDDQITLLDFTLLATNFNLQGDIPGP